MHGGQGADTFILGWKFGNDTVLDFARGTDKLGLASWADGLGPVFVEIDTNGDGVLGDADAKVTVKSVIVNGVGKTSTVIEVDGGSVTTYGVTGLTAADFF